MKKKLIALLLPFTLVFFFIATVFGLIENFFMIPCRWMYETIKEEGYDNDN